MPINKGSSFLDGPKWFCKRDFYGLSLLSPFLCVSSLSILGPVSVSVTFWRALARMSVRVRLKCKMQNAKRKDKTRRDKTKHKSQLKFNQFAISPNPMSSSL